MINQFDNSIPKIAYRAGDPPTMARQLTQGYLGLQTHGGNDRISYREIQVKEFQPSDLPVNTVAPSVTGSGLQDEPLTCNRGTWNAAAGSTTFYRWYRANKIPAEQPAPARAERRRTTAASPTRLDPNGLYGNQALTVAGFADRRHRRRPTRRPRRTSARRSTARSTSTTPARRCGSTPRRRRSCRRRTCRAARAPPSRRRSRLTLGTPATFGAFTPGLAKDYDASMTANVISTAGSASLSIADPSSDRTRASSSTATFSLPVDAAGACLQRRRHRFRRPGRRRRQRRADLAAQLRRADLQRRGDGGVPPAHRRERRAAHGHLQQDAHASRSPPPSRRPFPCRGT